jgi:hypothetical protein
MVGNRYKRFIYNRCEIVEGKEMVLFSEVLLLACYFGGCRNTFEGAWETTWFLVVLAVASCWIVVLPRWVSWYVQGTRSRGLTIYLLIHGLKVIVGVTLLLIFSQNLHPSRLSPAYIAAEHGCLIPVIVCMNIVVVHYPPRLLGRLLWELSGAAMVFTCLFSYDEFAWQVSYRLSPISGGALTLILVSVYAIPMDSELAKSESQRIRFDKFRVSSPKWGMNVCRAVMYIGGAIAVRQRVGATYDPLVDNTFQQHDYYSLRIITNADYFQGASDAYDVMVLKGVLSACLRGFILANVCMEFTAIRLKIARNVSLRYVADLYELTFLLSIFLVCAGILGASRDHDFTHSALNTHSTLDNSHSTGLLWSLVVTIGLYTTYQIVMLK